MSDKIPGDDKKLMYLGKPMVRSGNTIYYGDPAESCIIELQIMETTKVGEVDVATKVMVKLIATEDVGLRPRIIKKAEKTGLYEAMDIASIWLQRELANRA